MEKLLPACPPVAKTFVSVSGLPRSGTSLMMQLLAAGGLHVVRDEQRPPDVDNRRGYFEWEAIKQIGREPGLLDGIQDGAAMKCVSALLPLLPSKHRYRVLWMVRPIDEVLASQRKMIERRGTTGANLCETELAASCWRTGTKFVAGSKPPVIGSGSMWISGPLFCRAWHGFLRSHLWQIVTRCEAL